MDIKKQILGEGVNDPGIFKAIFLAGGPAAGKTFVAREIFGLPPREDSIITFAPSGLKLITSDTAFEVLLKKAGYGTDLDKIAQKDPNLFLSLTDRENPDSVRNRAKRITKERITHYIDGRLGVVIDGTGHLYSHVSEMREKLTHLGYDTYMVYVNTKLDVALQRNTSRARRLPDDLVKQSWNDAQKNMKNYQRLFGGNIIIIDNSEIAIGRTGQIFQKDTYKAINKFISKPIHSNIAKLWIEAQRRAK